MATHQSWKRLWHSILLLVAVAISGQTEAQNISVVSAVGQDVDTFINAHLVAGGVYVYNVEFCNADGNITKPQIGTFNSNGFVHLYMDSGVVMTTGNINVAPGPNNSGTQSNMVTGYSADNQLSSIASGSLNGCAWLDFDFVSMSPFITVNYCFGSEEYPEYVCSSFNDVFAFYITGPDPNTGQSRRWNMASIPHTVSAANPDGIAVAINTVNPGQAGGTGSSNNCNYNFSQYYVANTWSTGVQYDGFTQKLAASTTVVPCEEYHMHISICNVGDNAYDSGVFLENKSFSSPVAQLNFSNGTPDTIVHSHGLTVPLSVSGTDYSYGLAHLEFGGSALCGIDYLCITSAGDTLTPGHPTTNISAPDHTLTFVGAPNHVIEDTLDIEVLLRVSVCESHPELVNTDTLRFILVEDDIVALRDTVIHAADTCRQVGVEVAYARRALTFRWDPTDDIDFPNQQYSTATITENRTYHVVGTDAMGNYGTATVEVRIGEESIATPTEASLRVYPNPTSGILNIEATGLRHVELWNAAGICVYSTHTATDRVEIDTNPFGAGTYTVVAQTEHGQSTHQVSIAH